MNVISSAPPPGAQGWTIPTPQLDLPSCVLLLTIQLELSYAEPSGQVLLRRGRVAKPDVMTVIAFKLMYLRLHVLYLSPLHYFDLAFVRTT